MDGKDGSNVSKRVTVREKLTWIRVKASAILRGT